MKLNHKITWLVLLTVVGSVAADGESLKGRIVGGGTLVVTKKFRSVTASASGLGPTRLYKDPPTFTAVTDRIPAKLGVSFGIVFELTNLPKIRTAVLIVLVTKHPAVRRPDGTTSTGGERELRFAVAGQDRIVSWAGFGFDRKEELVPGIWTFEVRSYSRLLCKKDFTVVRK
jgi:hypothetical protein